MDFNFDGLDEPISLPDEYFSVIQYERVERFLHRNSGEWEDFRFVRECLGEFLGDSEFLARTDNLPMNPHNRAEWEKINNHLASLFAGSRKIGDDVTDEAIAGPLENPTGPPSEIPDPVTTD